MYKIFIANSKSEKLLNKYLKKRKSIKNKIEKIKINPKDESEAHPLHGKLAGKWSCWLGSNIRMIYSIDETNKRIIIEAIGSHKIY